MADRIPVLIDTDVDIDDWMAILYLLKHPAVDVVGITTTGCGAAHLTPGTRNALDLLPLAGQPGVPVAAGTNRPLVYSNVFPITIRQPIDEVYHVPLPTNPNDRDPRPAVQFLYDTLMASPEPVQILAIGGGTNLGTLLREHPEVAPRIARVVVMGGAIDVGGNVNVVEPNYLNKVAEWNVFLDPLGMQLLLDSGVPVLLVPLDASNHVPLDLAFYNRLVAQHGTDAATFVLLALSADIDFVASGAFFFWDPLAAAALVDPTLVGTQPMTLRVVQDLDEEDDHSGQLVRDPSGAPVTVAMTADADRFYDEFLRVLNLPD